MKQTIKKISALLLTTALAASSAALPSFAAGDLNGFLSDTTQNVVKKAGQTYVFAVTPTDAKAKPYFTVGNGSVLSTFTSHAPVKQADGKITYYFGYKCIRDGSAGVYIRIGSETQRVFIGYVGQKSNVFAGGSGTVSDPYQVSNVQQLNAVKNNLTATYALIADIDLNGTNFSPIGTFVMKEGGSTEEDYKQECTFSGTFDGRGHTISNVVSDNSKGMCSGLFGTVSSKGTVKNLTVSNVESTAAAAAGGIIGYNMGTAEALTLKGNSTVTSTCCAGGIVGGNGGSAEATIKNCTVENVNVIITGDNKFTNKNITPYDSAECGGLIVGGSNSGVIDGCKAKGTITADGNEPLGLGGISGALVGMKSITNCSANVTINASKSAHAVGGIGGYAGNLNAITVLQNCTATVNLNVNGATLTGGLIGSNLVYQGKEGHYTANSCNVTGVINGAVAPGSLSGISNGGTYTNCTANVTADGKTLNDTIGKADRLLEYLEA